MTELTGRSVGSVIELATGDDRAANPGRDGEVQEVVDPAGCSEGVLAERGDVRVTVEVGRQAEGRSSSAAIGMSLKSCPRLGGLTITPVHGLIGPGADTPIPPIAGADLLGRPASAACERRDAGLDHGLRTEPAGRRRGVPGDPAAVGQDGRGADLGAAKIQGENGSLQQAVALHSLGWDRMANSSKPRQAARIDRRRSPRSRQARRSPVDSKKPPPAFDGGFEIALWREGQPPILKTLPPQIGQVPLIAGLPFFIVIFWGFSTSTFFLSLTQ